MASWKSRGVEVAFPYAAPYDAQKVFIERLIESLQTGQNAMLESPTGTGKTLCLLCGALSWQQAYVVASSLAQQVALGAVQSSDADVQQATLAAGVMQAKVALAGSVSGGPAFRIGSSTYRYADIVGTPMLGGGAATAAAAPAAPGVALGTPKIIYATRTHSQISQVVRELKRSGFAPRTAILGSRGQLCVNPRVSAAPEASQNAMCRTLTRGHKCIYKNGLDRFLDAGGSLASLSLDGPPPAAPKSAGSLGAVPGGPGTRAKVVSLFGGAAAQTTRPPGSVPVLGPSGVTAAAFRPGGASGVGPARTAASGSVMDIEELVSLGRAREMCPYYLPRSGTALADADLLLLPYTYLVDPAVRNVALADLNWSNAVVIFDEAHNIADVASEAASFNLTAGDLARCIEELHAAIAPFLAEAQAGAANATLANSEQKQADALSATLGFDPQKALGLRQTLLQLESNIDSLPLEVPEPVGGFAGPADAAVAAARRRYAALLKGAHIDARVEAGSFVYALLSSVGITEATKDELLELLDAVLLFLVQRQATGATVAAAGSGGAGSNARGAFALEHLRSIIERVFRGEGIRERMHAHYRLLIYTPPPAGAGHLKMAAPPASPAANSAMGRTVSLWCFSASVAMRELMDKGVRSLILASGTLSPMEPLAAELQLPFPIRLENCHVVRNSQVVVSVLSAGPNGKALRSDFANRDTEAYKSELGAAIADVLRVVPDGALVFFPSYSVMTSCIAYWQASARGLWARICASKKTALVEARAASELASQIATFNAAVEGGSGAVFFAVARGKVSEGVDFSDAHGRAVIVTGLPFPPQFDARVLLKRCLLDEAVQISLAASKPQGSTRTAGPLTGQEWYSQQAWRAVNQAVGRVIRHKDDFGAIILMDERFSGREQTLSAWLRPVTSLAPTFQGALSTLTQFFADNTMRFAQASEGLRIQKAMRDAMAKDAAAPAGRAASSASGAGVHQDDGAEYCGLSSELRDMVRTFRTGADGGSFGAPVAPALKAARGNVGATAAKGGAAPRGGGGGLLQMLAASTAAPSKQPSSLAVAEVSLLKQVAHGAAAEFAAIAGDVPSERHTHEPCARVGPEIARNAAALPKALSFGLGHPRAPPVATATPANPAARSAAPASAASSAIGSAAAPKAVVAQAVLDTAKSLCVSPEAYTALRNDLKFLVATLRDSPLGPGDFPAMHATIAAFVRSAAGALGVANSGSGTLEPGPMQTKRATTLFDIGRFVRPEMRGAYRDAVAAMGLIPPPAAPGATSTSALSAGLLAPPSSGAGALAPSKRPRA